MRRYWILFFVLMTAIYIKSRHLDLRPGMTPGKTIRQLKQEINELKKNQEHKWVVLEKTRQ